MYGVYLIETVQTMILLYDGIPIYNVPSIDTFPVLRDEMNLWVALPLLGGIGMFAKINTGVGDSLPQTPKLHLSSNHFTRIAFGSSHAHGPSSPSLFWYDFLPSINSLILLTFFSPQSLAVGPCPINSSYNRWRPDVSGPLYAGYFRGWLLASKIFFVGVPTFFINI